MGRAALDRMAETIAVGKAGLDSTAETIAMDRAAMDRMVAVAVASAATMFLADREAETMPPVVDRAAEMMPLVVDRAVERVFPQAVAVVVGLGVALK